MPHIEQAHLTQVAKLKKRGLGFLNSATSICFCTRASSKKGTIIFVQVEFDHSGTARFCYRTDPANSALKDADLSNLQDIYDVCIRGPWLQLNLHCLKYAPRLDLKCSKCLKDSAQLKQAAPTSAAQTDAAKYVSKLLKANISQPIPINNIADSLATACRKASSNDELDAALLGFAKRFKNNAKTARDQRTIEDWNNWHWQACIQYVYMQQQLQRDHERDRSTNALVTFRDFSNQLFLPAGIKALSTISRTAEIGFKFSQTTRSDAGYRHSFVEAAVEGVEGNVPPFHPQCSDLHSIIKCVSVFLRRQAELRGDHQRRKFKTEACRLLGLPNLAALRLDEIPDGETPDYQTRWETFEEATPEISELREVWRLAKTARIAHLRGSVQLLKSGCLGRAVEILSSTQQRDPQEPEQGEERLSLVREIHSLCQSQFSSFVERYSEYTTLSPDGAVKLPVEGVKDGHEVDKHDSPREDLDSPHTLATPNRPNGLEGSQSCRSSPDTRETRDERVSHMIKEGLQTPPATNPTHNHLAGRFGTLTTPGVKGQHSLHVFTGVGTVEEASSVCQERHSNFVDQYTNRPTFPRDHQPFSEASSESAARGSHDESKPSASHSSPGSTRPGPTTAAWRDTATGSSSDFDADEGQTLLPGNIIPESAEDPQHTSDLGEGHSIMKEGLHTPPATNPISHRSFSQSGTIGMVEGSDQRNSNSNVFSEIGPAVRITSDLLPPEISQDSQWLEQLNSVDMPGQPDIGFEITPQPHRALHTLATVATGEAPLPLGDDSAALDPVQSPWLSRPLSSSSAYPKILNPVPTAGPDPPAVDWQAVKMEQVDRLLYDIPTPDVLGENKERKRHSVAEEDIPAKRSCISAERQDCQRAVIPTFGTATVTIDQDRPPSSSNCKLISLQDGPVLSSSGHPEIQNPSISAGPETVDLEVDRGPSTSLVVSQTIPKSVIQEILTSTVTNIIYPIWFMDKVEPPVLSVTLPLEELQSRKENQVLSVPKEVGDPTVYNIKFIKDEKLRDLITRDGFGLAYWTGAEDMAFVTIEVVDQELLHILRHESS